MAGFGCEPLIISPQIRPQTGVSDNTAWIGIGAPLIAPMLIGLTFYVYHCRSWGCGIDLNSRDPDFWSNTVPLALAALVTAWQTFWAVRLIRHVLASGGSRAYLLLALSLYILALMAVFTAAQFGLPAYPYTPAGFALAWAAAGLALLASMLALRKARSPLLWVGYVVFVPLIVASIHLLRGSWICGRAISQISIYFLPILQAPWLMVGLAIGVFGLIYLAIRSWIAESLGWKRAVQAVLIALPLAIGAGYFLYGSAEPDISFHCGRMATHHPSSLRQVYGPFFW